MLDLKIGAAHSNKRATGDQRAEVVVRSTQGNFTLSAEVATKMGLLNGDYVFLFDPEGYEGRTCIVKGSKPEDERGKMGHKLSGSINSNCSFSGKNSWEILQGNTENNRHYAVAGITDGYGTDEDPGSYIIGKLAAFGDDVVRELIFIEEVAKSVRDFSKKDEDSSTTIDESAPMSMETDEEEVVTEDFTGEI